MKTLLFTLISLFLLSDVSDAQNLSLYGSLSRQQTVRENIAYRQQAVDQAKIRGLLRETRRNARLSPRVQYRYATVRVVRLRNTNTCCFVRSYN